jgi:hypothetical protein
MKDQNVVSLKKEHVEQEKPVQEEEMMEFKESIIQKSVETELNSSLKQDDFDLQHKDELVSSIENLQTLPPQLFTEVFTTQMNES